MELPKCSPNRSPNITQPDLHAPPTTLPKTPPTALQNDSLNCHSKPRPQDRVAATIHGQNAALAWGPPMKHWRHKWWNIEKKSGHNVARPLARKRPKFLVSLVQICKDSLLGTDSEPGRSGHFLANGLATMWPLFFQCFTIFVSNVSLAGLRLGPHYGHESWPPSCLGGAVWRGSLGNHSGGWLRESLGELWGGARGGQVQVCLGSDVERTLEATQPLWNDNMAQAQP